MPVKESYSDRVFTTEVVSYPEMVHIGEDKDFTPVINKALELGGYEEDKKLTGINGGEYVTTGFAHGTVLSVADKVIDGVKTGKISHFFLVCSCDGARVVCILLTLLYLGIKDIYLGPTLPAFISPNVLKVLVDNYNISPITTPEEDLKKILNK